MTTTWGYESALDLSIIVLSNSPSFPYVQMIYLTYSFLQFSHLPPLALGAKGDFSLPNF